MSRRQLAAAALAGAIALGFWLWPGAEKAAPGGSAGRVRSEEERTVRDAPSVDPRRELERLVPEADRRPASDTDHRVGVAATADAGTLSSKRTESPVAKTAREEVEQALDAGAAELAAFERCHLVDAEPLATESNPVIVEVRAHGTWSGELSATLLMTPNAPRQANSLL